MNRPPPSFLRSSLALLVVRRGAGRSLFVVDDAFSSRTTTAFERRRPLRDTTSSTVSLRRRIHASARTALQFKLADIGEGIAQVEVLKWFVKPGDRVKQFDKLCEVSSDKATVEITSRFDGVVKGIGAPEGSIAKVGQVLVEFEEAGGDAKSAAAATTTTTTTTTTRDVNATGTSVAADVKSSTVVVPPKTVETATTTTSTTPTGAFDDLATPAVRHLAKEHGVNLKSIRGTGKDGRITKGDVLDHLNRTGTSSGAGAATMSRSPSPAPLPTTTTTTTTTIAPPTPTPMPSSTSTLATRVVSISGIRREMVKSMTQSLQIPHLGLMEEVTIDAAARFVRGRFESKSVLPLILKATSLALLRHPELNATTDEACTELYVHARHNFGVAMDTPKGLMVPVVYDVQNKTLGEIVEDLKRLRASGKESRFSMRDLGVVATGGNKRDATQNDFATMNLSNVGSVGSGTYSVPVITPPAVAIGGFGKARVVPRFKDESPDSTSTEIERVTVMHVSWSADHRVIDGATVSRFAKRFKELMESPLEFILEMR